MTRQELSAHIFQKQSYLCVGLDTDVTKLPAHLPATTEGMLTFNKAIIDATKDFCVAYKINTAFYEAMGAKGWEVMAATADYIPSTHFKIADAKRGDIGNTSEQYAKAFFETVSFDAVTIAPYMGEDSVRPFLGFEGKWAIVLGLTSNKGAADFEMKKLRVVLENLEEGIHTQKEADEYLYETVLRTTSTWGTTGNLMFVVGATQPQEFINIRRIAPNHFYLVPGVGAQGGSLEEISRYALTPDGGLLVNASRAVIYASNGEDFADAAMRTAKAYADEMCGYLNQR